MDFDIDHTFVTSDHHFGSGMKPGPFKVFTPEQEKELVRKWNDDVSSDDMVIYNGDFCDGILMDAMKFRSMLNGHVMLVRGNHDLFSDDVYRALFDDVFKEIILDKFNIVIHHKPVDNCSMHQVYGHMHRGEIVGPLDKAHNFCSCVQAHDGRVVRLSEIVGHFKQQTKQEDG